ncbi:MAG: 5-deoxy-glucuronate isomerase [Hyphomicrobiales bacterium]|nr:5-deoxy-glucuronate isomerase [Hyphomicrobiales bacterium]
MSSHLHLRPRGTSGCIHEVTPQSAHWTYVGFAVHRLAAGEVVTVDTGSREFCVVPLAGSVNVEVGGHLLGSIGGREGPFAGPPSSAYVPPRAHMVLKATSPCEVALCSAPAQGLLPARLIAPSDVGQETRGKGSNTRHVANILPDSSPHAESLLVVEVITPAGNWSSYPPHKHDRDALPAESQLEETYYHRFNPPQGYGVQRVYTDDRALDETITVEDRDVVLVPRGYHPVGAAHGYDLFYLNVMAGPKRIWKFHNDPAHEWLMKA